MKEFKGKKTITVNVFALVSGLAARYGFDVDPDILAAILAVVLPSVNIWLRFITTTPIFEKA